MRVTGGEFGGRILKVPPGEKVRPTQDRVREALFSMLMNRVEGAKVIDLFAGSGSVGIEALSRGALSAVWVENNKKHLGVLRKNIEQLVLGRGEIVFSDVDRWLVSGGAGRSADIIFADPPYDVAKSKGFADMMAVLAEKRVIAEGGLFVAEMPTDCGVEEVDGWELVKDRAYGKTRIVIYRKQA